MRPPGDGTPKKRKPHTKSRRGCNNCKLRKVKCDESKPKCEKCSSYGVSCDYETQALQLHFSGTGSFQVEMQKPEQINLPPAFDAEKLIASMMDAPLYLHVEEGAATPDVCYLDKAHLDLLRKFHNRSVLTIGTPDSVPVYQRVLTQMASKYSFVLHAALRFTLLHDRYLFDPLRTPPSEAEAFHGYHAAALFSKMLSLDSHSSDVKDALWGTSALLGAGTFAAVEATSAEEAWPLKLAGPSDLDWLKMSEGKNAVWRLADPARDDGVFRAVIVSEFRKQQSPSTKQVGPPADKFLLYCASLNNDSQVALNTENSGPYLKATAILERLITIECSHETVIWFLSFLGHMEITYMQLVANKDPPALLLLSWWYAKLLHYNVWWVSRRCLFECRAICIYLKRILPAGDAILDLLDFPMSACGLDR